MSGLEGRNYASKYIPEETGKVDYVSCGETFDPPALMRAVKKSYGVDVLLNDGGRPMTREFKRHGHVWQENITVVPYNSSIPADAMKNPRAIFGRKGDGLDGSELSGAIKVYSRKPFGFANINIYVPIFPEKEIS